MKKKLTILLGGLLILFSLKGQQEKNPLPNTTHLTEKTSTLLTKNLNNSLKNKINQALESIAIYEEKADWKNWRKQIDTIYKIKKSQKSYDDLLQFLNTKKTYLEQKTINETNDIILKVKVHMLYRLAYCYRQINDTENSLIYYERVIERIIKDDKNKKLAAYLASSYKAAAKIYSLRKNFDKAIEYYKQSESICQRINKTKILIKVYTEWMATLSFRQKKGDKEKIKEIYDKAIQIPKISDSQKMDLKINAFGETAILQKEYKKAIPIYEEALTFYKEDKNTRNVFDIYLSLINIYTNLNNNKMALAYCEKAAKYAKEKNVNAKLYSKSTTLQSSFGDIYFNQKNYQKALKYHQKALHLTIPSFTDTTNVYKNPTVEQINANPYIVTILRDKAKVFKAIYKENQEINNIEKALECYELSLKAAELLQRDIKFDEARDFLSEYTYNYFEEAIGLSLELAKQTDQKEKYYNKAFTFSEKSKAISLKKSLQAKTAQAILPTDLLRKEAELKEKLSTQKNQDSIRAINRQIEEIITHYETNYPKYFALKYVVNVPTIKEVQQQLTEDQALIEYFVGDSTIYTFCIVDDALHIATTKRQEGFTEKINDLHKALSNKDSNSWKNQTHEAYNLWAKKSIEYLPPNITKITIVPDGELNYIPFEVLTTQPNTTHFLLEDYAINYRYYLSNKEEKQIPQTNLKNFGGFAPNYENSTLGSLTYGPKSTEVLANKLEGDAWIKEKATKQNFKGNANKYKMLHLSMHGIIDDNQPMKSKLMFKDESLNAEEIYNLNLNANLSTLSACNTGVGKLKRGEGIMSLGRAFTYAGCHSLLISLWQVPENTTTQIMEDFYHFLSQGNNKDIALQKAKIKYLKNTKTPTRKHPYYWSAFIQIGNTQAITKPQSNHYKYIISLISLLGLVLLIGFFRKR